MEGKIFKVPPEYKHLNSFYRQLKQSACEELKKHGISQEPRQVEYGTLQDICNQNPKGPLATYVVELKKGFRMNQEELRAYDSQKENQQKFDDPMEEEIDWDALDTSAPVDDSSEIDFGGIDNFLDEN